MPMNRMGRHVWGERVVDFTVNSETGWASWREVLFVCRQVITTLCRLDISDDDIELSV